MAPPIKATSFGKNGVQFRHHFAWSGWNFAALLGRGCKISNLVQTYSTYSSNSCWLKIPVFALATLLLLFEADRSPECDMAAPCSISAISSSVNLAFPSVSKVEQNISISMSEKFSLKTRTSKLASTGKLRGCKAHQLAFQKSMKPEGFF